MLKNRLLILFCLLSISPYLFYLSQYPLTPARDWEYFNSLSLLIGENFKSFQIPLLDPWICGGIDILGNPQNWVFSPFAILNLVLPPYLANLVSLIICALIGFMGMLKLAKDMPTELDRYVMATLFTLSPFFFLHFAEGHIPYRTFYFLPWMFYFAASLNSSKKVWYLLTLFVIMFLDGGIYPFYFSIFLVLFNLDYKATKELFLNRNEWKNLACIFLAVLFLLLAKAFPVLFIHANRVPQDEVMNYSWSNLVQAFFDIRQSNYFTMLGQKYYMHEYAHYLGIGLTLLLLTSFSEIKKKWKLVLQLVVFTWTALGIGGVFNPWTLIKLIPLVNHIHVQSRFLILMFFVLLLLIIKSFNSKSFKKWFLYLSLAELLFCAFFVSNSAFIKATDSKSITLAKTSLAQTQYERYIPKPDVYHLQNLSYKCYEPANPNLLASSSSLFLETSENLQAIFTNNQIHISSPNPITQKFVLNYHWNGGWDCVQGCDNFENKGLIQVNPTGEKEIILEYNPIHWQISLLLFAMGLSLMIFVRRRI